MIDDVQWEHDILFPTVVSVCVMRRELGECCNCCSPTFSTSKGAALPKGAALLKGVAKRQKFSAMKGVFAVMINYDLGVIA